MRLIMPQQIYTIDDIKSCYVEFVNKLDSPRIENLTNWGRHRLFLAKYFPIKDSRYSPSDIMIEFNTRTYHLDTTKAPEFLDQHNYLAWLQGELLKA